MKDKALVSSTDSMGKTVRVLTTLVEVPSFVPSLSPPRTPSTMKDGFVNSQKHTYISINQSFFKKRRTQNSK